MDALTEEELVQYILLYLWVQQPARVLWPRRLHASYDATVTACAREVTALLGRAPVASLFGVYDAVSDAVIALLQSGAVERAPDHSLVCAQDPTPFATLWSRTPPEFLVVAQEFSRRA